MLRKIVLTTVMIVITVMTLYPVLTVVTVSLRPADRLLSTSLEIIPDDATFDNYIALFTERPFARWLLNSTLVAAAVTIFATALASTAGYAFSRFRFPGYRAGMSLLLITQMFPATMLLLPLFLMLAKLHLINSYLGLMVVYSATALPFTVWQMKGYYDTIPRELEEAAMLDGASRFRIYWSIVLPLARPAMATVALFAFVGTWNDFFGPLIYLNSPDMATLTLGLNMLKSQVVGTGATQWNLLMAGAVLVMLPNIVVFILAQKYFVRGIAVGGLRS